MTDLFEKSIQTLELPRVLELLAAQAATEERTVTISSYVMVSSGRKAEPSPAKNPLAAMAFTPSAYQASAATSEK